jgi:hypothetical protein
MNIFKTKAIVIILSLILFAGATSIAFSASKKEISSTMKSGSVKKQLVAPKIKSKFDLSIERVYLNQKCQVIVELKNKGINMIPGSVFKRISVNLASGKLKINKKLNKYDRTMRLRYPGKKLALKTGVIAKEIRSFSVILDKYNVLKETNEANNKKNIKLVPGCENRKKKIQKPALPDKGFRANTSVIPGRQVPRKQEFRSSEHVSAEHRTASVSGISRIMDRTRDEGITITSPRPARRYMQGHNIPVRFSISTVFAHWSPDTRPTAFRIMLASDDSLPVNLYEGSETNLDLLIPVDMASGDSYKIVVYGMEDPSWYGVAGNFSIGLSSDGVVREGLPSATVAPFLRIAEPTGLISWYAGCTQRIKLTTNATLTNVNLNLLNVTSGGSHVIQSDAYSAGTPTVVGGQNQYTIFYQIPSDAGDNGRLGHYRLGIEQIGGEELEVISGNIWLHRSGYQIIRPAGGNYWENLTVDWEATGCAAESYDIQLVRQGPGDPVVTEIGTGISASYASPSDIHPGRFAQSFHWSIPEGFARGTYKVRLIVHERGLSEERIIESSEFPILER